MNRLRRLCPLLAAALALLSPAAVVAQASDEQIPAPSSPSTEERIRALEEDLRALRTQLAQAPPAPPPAPPPQASPPPALPVAGWSGGNFFLQSRDGAFRLIPTLRLQIDGFVFLPSFTAPGQPRDTISLRRVRPEFFGSLFRGRVDFMLAGDFAVAANGLAVTDAFLIFNLHDWFHVQVGQFDLPFTLENRTSDRFIDFMERSFVVRNLGPANKEPGVMFFGGPRNRLFYYSVGVFNGDGINVANLDNAFDVVGRAFTRPLVGRAPLVERLQVGLSLSYGTRQLTNATIGGPANQALSGTPGWLTTQSAYPFLRTSYVGADGHGTVIGVVPQGRDVRAGAEFNLPIGQRVGLRSEYVYLKADVNENLLLGAIPLRAGGTMEGHGVYSQVSFWPVGNSGILPDPGIQAAPLFDATAGVPVSKVNLQLLARFDYARLSYQAGQTLGANQLGPSQVAGDYTYWGVAFGANLWWTRHVRLSLNYLINHIDGKTANLPAPGQEFLHEIDARVALAL